MMRISQHFLSLIYIFLLSRRCFGYLSCVRFSGSFKYCFSSDRLSYATGAAVKDKLLHCKRRSFGLQKLTF